MNENLAKSGIPTYLKVALEKYVEQGQIPGGFLLAVLKNDLMKTFEFADHFSWRALPAIITYLFNDVPAICWGTPERVAAWMMNGGREGLEANKAARESRDA